MCERTRLMCGNMWECIVMHSSNEFYEFKKVLIIFSTTKNVLNMSKEFSFQNLNRQYRYYHIQKMNR